jgi:hypothetical protein
VIPALITLVISAAPCESGAACAKQAFETRDAKQSLELYERACALKLQSACAQAALITQDAARAKKLCTAQVALGCGVQGVLALDTKDESLAMRCFKQACELGLLAACGPNSSYEYALGPEKLIRFTHDRAMLPRDGWRVFKMDLPDRAAIHFTP